MSSISAALNDRLAPPDVEHLALSAQALDAERQLGPRRDEQVQLRRRQPDERLDETP